MKSGMAVVESSNAKNPPYLEITRGFLSELQMLGLEYFIWGSWVGGLGSE